MKVKSAFSRLYARISPYPVQSPYSFTLVLAKWKILYINAFAILELRSLNCLLFTNNRNCKEVLEKGKLRYYFTLICP